MSLKSIQQQLARSRGKTAVLGSLVVVLAILTIRAVQSFMPQRASGEPLPIAATAEPAHAAPTDMDADKRSRDSAMLWSVLREKRGLDANVAYRFDNSYYDVDPSKAPPRVEQQPVIETQGKSDTKTADQQQQENARRARIAEQARSLELKTTLLGPEPQAVIKYGDTQRVMRVSEVIGGFRINAIEGRNVEVEKEGVKVLLGMGNESRP